jgi:hypothetical protein
MLDPDTSAETFASSAADQVPVPAQGVGQTPAGDSISEPTQEQIAVCAFAIWEREGCPEGRADEHWHQAEVQLRQTGTHQ